MNMALASSRSVASKWNSCHVVLSGLGGQGVGRLLLLGERISKAV